jgi:hypothetical protein
MRCTACDKNLNDFEATRKIINEEGKVHYPDLCNTCFKESGIGNYSNVVERQDLNHYDDIDNDYPDEDGEYSWDKHHM